MTKTYLGEVALAVADEQTSLATSSISYNHNLLGVGRRLGIIGSC